MQDQLTSGQSSLQQQTGNSLQPNSSGLQQGGSPSVSSNVFTVLSQDAQTGGLRVQSAQTDTSIPSQTYIPQQSPAAWIVPVALVAAIIIGIAIWVRFREQLAVEELIPEEAPAEVPEKVAPKPRTTKKTSRRKRQSKR